MTSLQNLSHSEIDMVHEWLRAMGMPVSRKINRDYADGVLVAKLMKKLYPRLLDTQAYHTHNGLDMKLVNWQVLQFRVFNRIGLPMSRKEILALATGENGVLEKLLWKVMAIAPKKSVPSLNKSPSEFKRKDKLKRSLRSSKSVEKRASNYESSELVEVDKLSDISVKNQGNAAKQSIQKIVDITEQGMVPFAVYEGVINEVRSKDNTIKAFKTKVAILERIIQERESEILDLKHKAR